MLMGRPEDSRVKIPALVHFTRLGYTYMSIKDKECNVDYDGDTNIFYSQFLSAVNRINQTELTLEDAKKIIGELKIKLDNDDLGKSFFKILQSGIDGIKLIDFSDITGTKNDYTVVTELPYENGDDNFRPDIVVLINGMPLSFIEVKRQNNREGILTERSRMERRFGNKIYRRFVGITQFTVFSNNNEYDDSDIEPIQGAFYASSSYKRMFFSKFREQREDELKADMQSIVTETEEFVLSDNNLIAIKGTPEYVSSLSEKSPTNRIITSLYTKERLLFLLKYGICYKTTTNKDGITEIEKHIMRYPQLFATLAIRDKLREGVRKGVIWHTQGSGKTALAYSNVQFLTDYFSKEEGKFVSYYLLTDAVKMKINNSAVGSTMASLNTDILGDIDIILPDCEEQKRIALILGTIDKKISNNNQINDYLCAQLQILFSYLFNISVMPESWTQGVLADIANITMGQSPSGESFNTQGNGYPFYQGSTDFGTIFPAKRMYTDKPSRYAAVFDTLLSVRAPVGSLNIAYENCCIGRGLASIHGKYDNNIFVRYLLKNNKWYFDNINNNGTTFGPITKDYLFEMPVVIPDGKSIAMFEQKSSLIERQIYENEQQTRKLQNLRDWLLPMLMNGQATIEN